MDFACILRRVALIVAAAAVIPATQTLWNSLVVRVHQELAREGLTTFLGRCAMAGGFLLLHWLASRQESVETLIKEVTETDPMKQAPLPAEDKQPRPKSD
mmetsp:Transcript_10637/g.20618  ORF Transcript_10637/g.20618 Transcript_10637/m.20618 type:complete len:100 (+) Transcript_10637:81-380(+)